VSQTGASARVAKSDYGARTQNGHIRNDTRDVSRRISTACNKPICRRIRVADDPACTRVTLRNLHGKEGVDGSSPSEGFAERPANWRFSSPSRATRGYVAGTCLVLATHRDSPFWHRSDTASISIVGEDLQIERLCPIVSVGEEPDPLPAERGSAVRVRQRAQQRRHAERWRTHRLPGQLTTEDAARRSR
jgi:hypothetical protein